MTVVSMQMNGTLDVRDVFREALGESRGKNYFRRTTSTNAHRFFQHISRMHYKKDKTKVKYAFKKCGGKELWSVLNLENFGRQSCNMGEVRNSEDGSCYRCHS